MSPDISPVSNIKTLLTLFLTLTVNEIINRFFQPVSPGKGKNRPEPGHGHAGAGVKSRRHLQDSLTACLSDLREATC